MIMKKGERARYRMKYKARARALPPHEMRAKALAENKAAKALAEALARQEEE